MKGTHFLPRLDHSEGAARSRGHLAASQGGPAKDGDAAAHRSAHGGGRQITKELLLEAIGSSCRPRSEPVEQFVAKHTHLKIQGLRIGPSLDRIGMASQVYVLYAYDNLISTLRGLETLKRLQQLYLQNNRLADMNGIEALVHLRKLHLGRNRIPRIEGLHNCKELQELYVPHQRLSFALELCPRTIAGIAPSLKLLDASGNQLVSAAALAPLQALHSLDLSDNELAEIHHASEVLSGPCLRRVWLRDNPFVQQERKYRAGVVLLARELEELDGKEILPVECEFTRLLEARRRKAMAKRHKQANAAKANDDVFGGIVRPAPRASMDNSPTKKPHAATAAPPVLQDLLH